MRQAAMVSAITRAALAISGDFVECVTSTVVWRVERLLADSATPYSQLKKYAISFAVVRQKIPHSSADHGMPSV